ncbi:MAG: aspartate/glutamate racemase family protein [Betaproteobacteria bacterium]|nr:aspartate/glutamate racemase family protein [Betaproteobacteria bacterium]
MGTWERKLGLIVPSWNTVMEYEVQRMAGTAMSVHSMRIPHTGDTEENLLRLATEAPAAAKLLAHAKVDVIGYGCTAGGFLKGPEGDRKVGAEIAAATGTPVATSAAAVADALRAVGAKRVGVASPYAAWLNERVRAYLEADGFEVVAIQGLGTEAHSTITLERVEALAAEVNRPEAQAIFISCSNFRTLEIIESLERRFGKPVVTSNASSMWKMLRLMGDRRAVPGAGRLFREA